MKKYFSALCAGLVVAGALSGCSDDDFGNGQNGSASAGEKVNFTLGGPSSRTVYDDEDEYQINWTDGDKVRIYCDEAEDVKQADYSVLKSETEESEGKLQYNENGLAWGGMDEHHFYAVYPADDSKVSVSNGIARFRINQYQRCEFSQTSDGNYVGSPDMSNAYMTASLATTPVDEVKLSFEPIMTTLEITLRGRNEVNEPSITVTGLSIISKVGRSDDLGWFNYDVANKTIVGDASAAPEQTTLVGIRYFDEAENAEKTFIDLPAGKSVTFTVFLPPVDINAANQIEIRPNVAGPVEMKVTVGGNTDAEGKTVEYKAKSKGKLTLPAWPGSGTDVTGNNWITPLDDNIYVQQLSIPGTHDAAAYETTGLNLGATQDLTIGEQFDMGIRAFDLRAAKRALASEFWLYHGITATSISLKDALTTLSEKLIANEGEFVIVQLRHEKEGKPLSDWKEDLYEDLKGYDAKVVPWKPDLTIGDCRGSIVVLTRDDYDGRSKAGLISNWPDNTSVLENNVLAYINGTTPYYVQDYYRYFAGNIFGDPEGSRKAGLVEALLEVTKQFKDPTSDYFQKKAWALNHTSGYATSFLSITEWTGTTVAYQSNAARVNPQIYNYMQNQTDFGPTGIIFMDWVGARDATSYRVYGDLLPQVIIDNNYRYTMLRKQ